MEKNKQISHLQHSHDIRRYFVAYCVVPAGCAPVENDDVTRCAWLLNAPAHLSTLGGFFVVDEAARRHLARCRTDSAPDPSQTGTSDIRPTSDDGLAPATTISD